MTTQHTPAPWNAKGQLVFAGENCQATFIAHCNPDNDLFQSTAEANARLIAASPLMLKGYEEILKIISGTDLEHGSIGMIVKTQIAQARGQ